jgi:hypothetical protein
MPASSVNRVKKSSMNQFHALSRFVLERRLGAALDGIVDDAEPQGLAGDLPVHRGVAEAALLPSELDELRVALRPCRTA